MKKSFLNHDKAILTSMVQADNPDRIKELVDKSLSDGAEALGMQFCRMKKEYRKSETYRDLFSYCGDKPVYVTNYRIAENTGKSDEILAEELLELADCGATLCDVIGDLYDRQPGEHATDKGVIDRQPDELATDKDAIDRQIELIDTLHQKGAEVLMSSHILKFTPAERVLEVALEHQRRGADISKIVTNADSVEQQIENLKIINLLKENLKIPFLFLCGGECNVLRKIGGEFGCCMYLCVCEHDEFSTPVQPLLKNVKTIRENL